MSFSKSAGFEARVEVPHQPVQLVVVLAIVERKSVLVLLGLVERDFLANNLRRKQAEAEQLVPDQVVLLTPGAGRVESQTVVVAVVRQLHRLRGKLLGGLAVERGVL